MCAQNGSVRLERERRKGGNWAQDSPTEAAVHQEMLESTRTREVHLVHIFNKSVSEIFHDEDNSSSSVAVEGLVLLH